MTRMRISVSFLLAFALFWPAAGLGAEPVPQPPKLQVPYEQWHEAYHLNDQGYDYAADAQQVFEARFGTETNRPPREVLEKRCVEDLIHYFVFRLYESPARYDYHALVAGLLEQSASKASLPALEFMINHTWMESFRWPSEKGVDPRVPHSLTTAWLNVKFNDASPEEKAAIYADAMRLDGRLKLDMEALRKERWLSQLSPAAREPIYRTLREGNLRTIYNELNWFWEHPPLAPTDDDLWKFTRQGAWPARWAARLRLIRGKPSDRRVQDLLLEDILGDHDKIWPELDPYYVIHSFLDLLGMCLSANIPDADRNRLFLEASRGFGQMQDRHDQGKYLGQYLLDRNKGEHPHFYVRSIVPGQPPFRSDDPLIPFDEGRALALTTSFLSMLTGDWALVDREAVLLLVRRHADIIRRHVDWLEQAALRTPKEVYDASHHVETAKHWRERLKKLKP